MDIGGNDEEGQKKVRHEVVLHLYLVLRSKVCVLLKNEHKRNKYIEIITPLDLITLSCFSFCTN